MPRYLNVTAHLSKADACINLFRNEHLMFWLAVFSLDKAAASRGCQCPIVSDDWLLHSGMPLGQQREIASTPLVLAAVVLIGEQAGGLGSGTPRHPPTLLTLTWQVWRRENARPTRALMTVHATLDES
jgi:hypothetical protein